MAAEIKKKIFDFSLLRRVFSFVSPYRKKFYWSLVSAIALAIITPVRPFLIEVTVNKYIAGKVIEMVVWITVIQVALLLVETAIRFYFSYVTSWLGQTVVKDLRIKVYKKILGLNLTQFDKTPIGTLTTRTINDIEAINDIFSDGLIPIVADLLSIVSVLCVMFYVDWRLTLICVAPFPILIIGTYFFKESVNKSFIRVRNAVANLNAFVQEHITGMQVVQAFAAEDREFEKFKKINREHRNANINAIFAYSIFFPLVEIILAVSTALLVWWVAKETLHLSDGKSRDLTGMITSFYLYLNLLFRPLRVIADKFNVLQMGMIASERVFRVLDNNDTTPESPDTELIKPGEKLNGSIEFDKVWFAYSDENYVLKNVSFTVKAGETVRYCGAHGQRQNNYNQFAEPALSYTERGH